MNIDTLGLRNAAGDTVNPATEDTLVQAKDALEVATRLEARMKAGQPDTGYRIWLDTSDVSHIYVLEAPSGSTATDTGFRGVRIPKSATGLVGKQEVNTGGSLTFDNRTSDGGWG